MLTRCLLLMDRQGVGHRAARGFRRDHVIANLGNSPHVPAYVQDSFLESIQPTPGFLQSAYGDFIVASLGLADDDDDSDVRGV